jgi:hypothetical protein
LLPFGTLVGYLPINHDKGSLHAIQAIVSIENLMTNILIQMKRDHWIFTFHGTSILIGDLFNSILM